MYGEGLLIGHRWYDAQGIEPAFAFGFGLGLHARGQLGEATVTGEIATASRSTCRCATPAHAAGSTVVQCYVEPATR